MTTETAVCNNTTIINRTSVKSENAEKLPKSAQTILNILKDGNPQTFNELFELTSIAPRTIRFALRRLNDKELIIRKLNFRDGRQVLYQIKNTD